MTEKQKYLRFVGWDELQKFRGKNPEWIKILTIYTEKRRWMELLDEEQRWYFIAMQMYASRTKGLIDYSPEWIKAQINAKNDVDLAAMIKTGFLEVVTLEKNNDIDQTVTVKVIERWSTDEDHQIQILDKSSTNPEHILDTSWTQPAHREREGEGEGERDTLTKEGGIPTWNEVRDYFRQRGEKNDRLAGKFYTHHNNRAWCTGRYLEKPMVGWRTSASKWVATELRGDDPPRGKKKTKGRSFDEALTDRSWAGGINAHPQTPAAKIDEQKH